MDILRITADLETDSLRHFDTLEVTEASGLSATKSSPGTLKFTLATAAS
jgi:hypothetical protein